MKSRCVAVLVLLCASWVLADLGKYQDWEKGYVQHLLTKKEMKAFGKLKSEKEAEDFVALFWAKRDDTPGTPRNQFRERCEALAVQADEKYSTEKSKGYDSDRGKVLLLLGPFFATYQTTANDSEGGIGSEGSKSTASQASFRRVQYEIWQYRKEQLDRLPFKIQQNELRVQFKKEEGDKDYHLQTDIATVMQALAKAVEGWVKSPELTAVPEWARNMGLSPFAAKGAAILAGSEPPAPDKGLSTWATFFTSNKTQYGSAMVFLPEESFQEMPAQVQTYIRLVDGSGAEMAKMDEVVDLKKSVRGWYVDRSFLVKPGAYKLLYMVGTPEGAIYYSDVITMQVPDMLAPDAENLWLTLSNDVQRIQTTYYESDPFVFGGAKVVPNVSGVFKNTEDLWFFFNISNPQLDPATSNPKLSQKLEIQKDGRRITGAPDTLLAPEELTALSEGRWASGKVYNIAAELKLKPGAYKLKLVVKDQLSGREFVQERPFTVVP